MKAARVVLALLLAVPIARGDVVETRDGRRFEGKVVEESSSEVVVDTPLGTVRLPRGEVVRVERGPSPAEVYEARRREAKTAEDHFALALFCREKGLGREARTEYEETLRLEPDHPGANRALGRVLHGGKWMTREERDRLSRAASRPAEEGEGAPATAGTKDPPAGTVGPAGPPEAAVRRFEEAAREAAAAAGVPLKTAVSLHFGVAGPYEAAFLERVAKGSEAVLEFFERAFGEGAAAEVLGDSLGLLVVAEERESFERLVEHFASRTETVTSEWVDFTKRSFGFVLYDPAPLSVAARLGRPRETLLGHTLHHVGHLLLNRRAYDGRLLPPWYDEGFAALSEFEASGFNTIFCRAPRSVGGGDYAFPKPPSATSEDLDPARLAQGNWKADLARALRAGPLAPFETVVRREFSELTLLDIAQGMAVLDWLRASGPDALPRFHDGLRARMPPAPVRVPPPRPALEMHEACFGAACELPLAEAARRALTALPPPPPAPAKR